MKCGDHSLGGDAGEGGGHHDSGTCLMPSRSDILTMCEV